MKAFLMGTTSHWPLLWFYRHIMIQQFLLQKQAEASP